MKYFKPRLFSKPKIPRRSIFSKPGYRPTNLPNLTESYYHNPGCTGSLLTNKTLDQAFLETVEKYRNSNFIALQAYSENNFQLTFDQLDRQVSLLASNLLKLGLEPGNRLCLWAPSIRQS